MEFVQHYLRAIWVRRYLHDNVLRHLMDCRFLVLDIRVNKCLHDTVQILGRNLGDILLNHLERKAQARNVRIFQQVLAQRPEYHKELRVVRIH